jgi:hypothetical protein
MASRSFISRRARRRREGNVAILTVLMLAMMMGFVALSFDMGNVYRVRVEDQRAVDSAALAGAARLDGTDLGLSEAKDWAVNWANRHFAYNGSVALTTGDVVPGIWHLEATPPSFEEGGNVTQINAVKVTYRVPTVSLPFAAVLGKPSTPVQASAIAVGGGPSDATCGFPLAIPDCALGNAGTNGLCNYCMQMQDNNNDTVAWTGFDAPSSGPNIRDAVLAACFDSGGNVALDGDGVCKGQCVQTKHAPDYVDINNGNLINTGRQSFCELIKSIINRNGPTNPQPFTVTVPVVDAGGTSPNCPRGSQLSGSKRITGYAQLDIFAAKCGNADNTPASAPINLPGLSCTAPPSGKYLVGALHCDKSPTHDHAGGAPNGVSAEPRLVQ